LNLPSRGLALEPTYAAKQPAKRGDIGEVPTELCARWKEERARLKMEAQMAIP
jgi:hypothetical protein